MNGPPTWQPPPPRKMGAVTITLIIIAVLFIVAGPVAVMAIFGVRKYLVSAKTSEPKNTLGQMGKDLVTAYEGLPMDATEKKLCPSASHPVPASMEQVRGRRYQSTPADWTADGPNAGFGCFRFEMTFPQAYQYSYESTLTSFVLRAHGDLNGDGHISTFELHGQVVNNALQVSPTILEIDPEE